MKLLKHFIVLLVIVPKLVYSQTYLEIPPLKEVVIIPTELNQIKGKFLDDPTFNYAGFKLSLAIGCENQLIQERDFRQQIEKQRDSAQETLKQSQSDYRNAVENARIKSEAQEIIIQGLNSNILSEKDRRIKGQLRLGIISISVIGLVWGLTKIGVL